MKDYVTPFDELMQEADSIQTFLEQSPREEVGVAIERGYEVSEIIARTGKMLADANFHLDQFKQSEIILILTDQVKQNLPATMMKQLVDSACKDYNFLSKWCERLNRTATHQLDWARSVVSYTKSEMEASKDFNRKPNIY